MYRLGRSVFSTNPATVSKVMYTVVLTRMAETNIRDAEDYSSRILDNRVRADERKVAVGIAVLPLADVIGNCIRLMVCRGTVMGKGRGRPRTASQAVNPAVTMRVAYAEKHSLHTMRPA